MPSLSPQRLKPRLARLIDSPVGPLCLVGSDGGLAAILWGPADRARVPLNIVDEAASHPVLDETERQLREYFARQRRVFDLPLDLVGTGFQQKVWHALLRIPHGQTRSYAEIAQEIGHPTAVRAVGAANGRNPLSIVAPCHRVVGKHGALTGFAGGLPAKAYLLNLETQDHVR